MWLRARATPAPNASTPGSGFRSIALNRCWSLRAKTTRSRNRTPLPVKRCSDESPVAVRPNVTCKQATDVLGRRSSIGLRKRGNGGGILRGRELSRTTQRFSTRPRVEKRWTTASRNFRLWAPSRYGKNVRRFQIHSIVAQ